MALYKLLTPICDLLAYISSYKFYHGADKRKLHLDSSLNGITWNHVIDFVAMEMSWDWNNIFLTQDKSQIKLESNCPLTCLYRTPIM